MKAVVRIVMMSVMLYHTVTICTCGPATAELDTTLNAAGVWSGVPGTAEISLGAGSSVTFNGVVADENNSIYLGGTLTTIADSSE